MTITLTEWATTSWRSRAIRVRSAATRCSASSPCSRSARSARSARSSTCSRRRRRLSPRTNAVISSTPVETNSSSRDNPSIQPATNRAATTRAMALITCVRRTPDVWAPIEYTAMTEPRNAAPPTPMKSATTSAATTTAPATERAGSSPVHRGGAGQHEQHSPPGRLRLVRDPSTDVSPARWAAIAATTTMTASRPSAARGCVRSQTMGCGWYMVSATLPTGVAAVVRPRVDVPYDHGLMASCASCDSTLPERCTLLPVVRP